MANAPQLPAVPRGTDAALYDYLTQLNAVVQSHSSQLAPPNLPTNLTVTPIAGGNVIQFTRSNGVSFNLYASSSPDFTSASQQNLGSANTYTDNVGSGGVKRYYKVEALNGTGASSGLTSPKNGTTLALGSTATIPVVRPAQTVVFDTTIDANRPLIASIGNPVAGQSPQSQPTE